MENVNQIFTVGLKGFIVDNKKILILQGAKDYGGGNQWGLPGRRVQVNESERSLENILLREIREECGDNLQITVREPMAAWRFAEPDGSQIFLIGLRCEYQGGDITLSPEHQSYKWIGKNDNIGDITFIAGYQIIIERFLATL